MSSASTDQIRIIDKVSPQRGPLSLVVGQPLARQIIRGPDGTSIRAAGVTDAGKKGNNEDAFIVGDGLGVIVDAMGGGDHGIEAACVIAGTIHGDLSQPDEGPLIRAVRRAARTMGSEASKHGFDADRDGAVVAMARDKGTSIEGLVVGDPGLYIIDLTDKKIVERGKGQSTTDEFIATLERGDIDAALKYFVNMPGASLDDLVLEGEEAIKIVTFLTGLRARNEAISQPFVDRVRGTISRKVKQSFVTSAIGTKGIDKTPNLVSFKKEPGHTYMVLLCSDGVTKYLTEHELLQTCLGATNPNTAVIEINKVVQERQGKPEYPGPDHATAVVFLA